MRHTHPHKDKGARRKGYGTLERRANGVYLARWTADGKRYAVNTHTKDRAQAAAMLETLTEPFRLKDTAARLAVMQCRMDGVNGRLRQIEANAPALKIADAWTEYLRAPEREPQSERREAVAAARFRRFTDFMARRFPDVVELRQVTREHMASFIETLTRSCTAYTANDTIAVCRRAWKILADCERAKLGGVNIWDKAKKCKGGSQGRRALSADELARVCAHVKGEMRLLFGIGIYTGMRFGDCAMLTWQCVDMERRFISVMPRKTAHASGLRVVIPIHPALFAMLAETDAARRCGYVMPQIAEAYARCPANVLRSTQRVFKDCGIKTTERPTDGHGERARVLVGFHSLRHTFVSMAANAGAPLALVQSIVGHTTADMTRRYFHASEAALKSAVEALPNVTNADGATAEADARAAERWRRFVEVADALTPAERERARRYLDGAALRLV